MQYGKSSSLFLSSAILLLGAITARADFVAHEWGTFSSVQGSDGTLMEGLQHEEEGLPAFVYGRDGLLTKSGAPQSFVCQQKCKRIETPLMSGTLLAVNQKMETPVIYFYSDRAQKVSVSVQFPGGVISQWYPNSSSFLPAIGEIKSLANGLMSWDVEISPEKQSIPDVSPEDICAPARIVNSNYVRVGTEAEKFIFYRGLGRFSVPIQVQSQAQELKVFNHSDETIADAFLIQFDGRRGSVRSLGKISSQSGNNYGPISAGPESLKELDTYLQDVSSQLKTALEKSGLYTDEAEAMVATWSKSYFKTPGVRILYVLPRAWTDRLLPIQFQPTPEKLVRTLIGRVEILTAQEESKLSADVKEVSASGEKVMTDHLGRFAEPKLLRVKQLTTDSQLKSKVDRLLRSLN